VENRGELGIGPSVALHVSETTDGGGGDLGVEPGNDVRLTRKKGENVGRLTRKAGTKSGKGKGKPHRNVRGRGVI